MTQVRIVIIMVVVYLYLTRSVLATSTIPQRLMPPIIVRLLIGSNSKVTSPTTEIASTATSPTTDSPNSASKVLSSSITVINSSVNESLDWYCLLVLITLCVFYHHHHIYIYFNYNHCGSMYTKNTNVLICSNNIIKY